MPVTDQKKPKREAPQTKAKRLVAEYYNERCEALGRQPVDEKDVRILMWRNVVQEDTWHVILWIRDPEPCFYIVERHKPTDVTTLKVYTDYVTEKCS